MTLAVLKATGQIFCSMSFILGLMFSNDWPGLGRGWGRRAQRCGALDIAAYEVHDICMTSDVNLDHLVKVRPSPTYQIGKLRFGEAKLLVLE